MEVIDIETFRNRYGVRFAGTLRNQYSFDLNQTVFIRSNGKMIECRIIGKELPLIDNADYIYKIELPNGVKSPIKDESTTTLKCDSIFETLEDAKESAILHLDRMYKLDLDNVERFFKSES